MSAVSRMAVSSRLGRCVVDHVDDETADYYFLGTIAAQMAMSAWWRTVPVYEQPEPVSGEIECR